MTRLILASTSESRRQILAAAGVVFEIERPPLDESLVRPFVVKGGAPPEYVAAVLAELKAVRVSEWRAGVVIGCDQVLVCDGRIFDKVVTLAEAREVLLALRGKRHELITVVKLAEDQTVLWKYVDRASLWMREFSDDFLARYLVDEGEDILSAVGCYRIEGRGAHLFERVEGDLFAIRGLPLIPLLDALREFEVLDP